MPGKFGSFSASLANFLQRVLQLLGIGDVGADDQGHRLVAQVERGAGVDLAAFDRGLNRLEHLR